MRVLLWLLWLICLPGAADPTYLLHHVYHLNETHRYQTRVDMDDPGSTGPAKAHIRVAPTETVQQIKADGSLVLVTKIDAGSIRNPQGDFPLPNIGKTFTVLLDKAGNILSRDLGTGPDAAIAKVLLMTRQQFLPDHPLKIGQSYPYREAADSDNLLKLDGTITLVGLQPKTPDLPIPTLKVKATLHLGGQTDSAQPSQPLDMEVVSWVDPTTRLPLRIEGVIIGTFSGEKPSRIHFVRADYPSELKLSSAQRAPVPASLPSADSLFDKCLTAYDTAKTFQGTVMIQDQGAKTSSILTLQIQAENNEKGMVARGNIRILSTSSGPAGAHEERQQTIDDGQNSYHIYPARKQYVKQPHVPDKLSGLFRRTWSVLQENGGKWTVTQDSRNRLRIQTLLNKERSVAVAPGQAGFLAQAAIAR